MKKNVWMCAFTWICCGSVGLLAGQEAEEPAGEPVEILGRASGAFYRDLEDREPRREVIRTQAEFEVAFPKGRREFLLAKMGVEAVDFSKEMLLWGTSDLKSTGGFTFKVEEVRKVQGRLLVWFQEASPEHHATMAFTKPGEVVRIARCEGAVEWIRREVPPAGGRKKEPGRIRVNPLHP